MADVRVTEEGRVAAEEDVHHCLARGTRASESPELRNVPETIEALYIL